MTHELYEELMTFRVNYPPKQVNCNGLCYNYIKTEPKEQTILLLPGGLAVGEPYFSHINKLKEDYCVITMDYPASVHLENHVDGIQAILKKEGIEKIIIVGQSLGGIIAQRFVRKYPECISHLILTHTSAFTKDMEDSYIEEVKKVILKTEKMLRIIPYFVVKFILSKKMKSITDQMPEEERTFWGTYILDIYMDKSKKDNLLMMRLMLGIEKLRFSKEDLKDWRGHILIIDSDADTSIRERERLLYNH